MDDEAMAEIDAGDDAVAEASQGPKTQGSGFDVERRASIDIGHGRAVLRMGKLPVNCASCSELRRGHL